MIANSLLRLIRLPAACAPANRRAPAMVLVEVLAAAIILSLALSFFLLVLRGGAFSAAQAHARMAMLGKAETLLAEAHGKGPQAREAGFDPGQNLSWDLACAPALPAQVTDRLSLSACTATIQTLRFPKTHLVLHEIFAAPARSPG